MTNSTLQQRLSVDVWTTLIKIHWNWKSIGPIFRKKSKCLNQNIRIHHRYLCSK